MKIKQLIEELQKLNPEFEVILQRDPEGNAYSPAAGVGEAFYTAISSWSGECHHPDDVQEMNEEERKKLETVVVLWPVN